VLSKRIDNPLFNYNPAEGDDFRDTMTVEVRIGFDDDCYYLVEFEALRTVIRE